MINIKIIFAFSLIFLLNSCAQTPIALLGPAYSLSSTGSVYQAGFSYGSNQAITLVTGKTTGENIKEILQPNKQDTELRKLPNIRN